MRIVRSSLKPTVVAALAQPGGSGFVVDDETGQVWLNGRPLNLRADEAPVFRCLLERSGSIVPEEALMAPHAGGVDLAHLLGIVADINLLLEGHSANSAYVAHYPGQGLALVVAPGLSQESPRAAFPTTLFGRTEALAAIEERLFSHRFVSIVGPGGIGKTSVARALSERVGACYPDGRIFIDLAPMDDGRVLPSVLASALGMEVSASGARDFGPLAAFLRSRRLLVILDSCEHVSEWAAAAAEALLGVSASVGVLATSREALRADGEWVHQLGPVALPPNGIATAAQALASPAVQLFVARAFGARAGNGHGLTDSEAVEIARLCRKLDGLPLALELAAAMAQSRGVADIAREADMRLLMPETAPRDASGRHLTLGAMLDWSYDLLRAEEQAVLRRLSVFRGGFALGAACLVVVDDNMDADDVAEIILELTAKSLICAALGDADGRHRLLDTTRAYAATKLRDANELSQLRHAHARFLCELLEQAHIDWPAMARAAWMARFAPWLDDVRAALDWAFSEEGDALAGMTLTVTSFPLADQAGFVQEFGGRVEQALTALARMPDPPLVLRMRLAGYARDSLQGPAEDIADTISALHATLAEAQRSGIAALQGAPLTALWGFPFVRGDYPASLEASARIGAAARRLGDPVLALIGQRTSAQSLHFMGRHAEAANAARAALEGAWRRIPLIYAPSPVEIATSMRILLARILWLQGLSEQARQVCAESLECARQDRPVALCQAIGLAAIPLAMWNCEWASCHGLILTLEQHAERYSFGLWQRWTSAYRAVLAFLSAGDASAQSAIANVTGKHADHLATFDVRLVTSEAVRRVQAGQVGWSAPEVLRAQAASLLRDRPDSGPQAEGLLRKALGLAREQGALAWELRSASTLATLLQQRGDRDSATAILAPILGRFPIGPGSADIDAARLILSG